MRKYILGVISVVLPVLAYLTIYTSRLSILEISRMNNGLSLFTYLIAFIACVGATLRQKELSFAIVAFGMFIGILPKVLWLLAGDTLTIYANRGDGWFYYYLSNYSPSIMWTIVAIGFSLFVFSQPKNDNQS